MPDGDELRESLERAGQRREFDRYLSRQLKFLFWFVIVMLVVSPPLMFACSIWAEKPLEEAQVELEAPEGD